MTQMDREELIKLIEEPILQAYNRDTNSRSGKRKQNDTDNNDNSISSSSNSISSSNGTDSNLNSLKTSSSVNKSTRQVQLSEAQRDRRTVFVQQLSVRCTDQSLLDFFTENSCPVRNARIVIDKYTRKSKGVAYVEFFEEETVRIALKLSGKKILGVPIIVELTETEKNRIAQEAAILNSNNSNNNSTSTANNNTNGPIQTTLKTSDDFVRLYIGSLHPSLTESELEQLFEPFGELESVELLKEERTGISKGVAFVQYKKVGAARRALESLNGFELAGKAIRVGPVRVDPSKLKTESAKLKVVNETEVNVDDGEEENMTLDAKKRAELMQKLLSSRK